MIRYIETKDLPVLQAFHESIFDQSFDFENYINSTAFNYGIVLESEGVIKGYLVGQIIFEVADLFYVAVMQESKRCGYGQQLMDHYHQDCSVRGAQSLTLEVRVSNVAAITLYKKFGYEEVAVRSNYYSNGEDALLMIRELNS